MCVCVYTYVYIYDYAVNIKLRSRIYHISSVRTVFFLKSHKSFLFCSRNRRIITMTNKLDGNKY